MPAGPDLVATCPHCGSALSPLRIPDNAAMGTGGWEEPVHWVCFNDDCSYFREGWDWMMEQYEVRASYRYRVTDPALAGRRGNPIAVWSETALRDFIVASE